MYSRHLGGVSEKSVAAAAALILIGLVSFTTGLPWAATDFTPQYAYGEHNDADFFENVASPTEKCNCVIFRADDIQDYWMQVPQTALPDTFIEKSAPLSVGMVMHDFGSDPVIVDKVKEGRFSSVPYFYYER